MQKQLTKQAWHVCHVSGPRRRCFRTDSAIPRQVAPQQRPALFHRTQFNVPNYPSPQETRNGK
jgi:hypothetical protein